MRHLIQKQQFLLTILPGVDVFRAQQAASRYFREQLLPLLERIFDELSSEHEVIRLDRCVIDLGVMGAAILESGVVDEAMYRLMREDIRRMIEKELALHPAVRTGVRENALATWWYYMEHGRLPWNAEQLTEEDLRAVLELLSVDYAAISRLRKMLTERAFFLVRVVAQHSEGFLENLLAALTSSRQEGMAGAIVQAVMVHRLLEKKFRRLMDEAAAVAGPAARGKDAPGTVQGLKWWASHMSGFLQAPVHEQRAVLWRRLFFEAAARPAAFAGTDGMAILLRDMPTSRLLMEELLAEQEIARIDNLFIQAMRRWVKDMPMRSASGGADAGEDPNDVSGDRAVLQRSSVTDNEPGPSQTERQAVDKGASSKTDETVSPTEPGPAGEGSFGEGSLPVERALREDEVIFTPEAVGEEGIYLPNAGLILVHPFLSTLFHRLGFWDGAGFADVEARQRAVLLLHFLATGDHSPKEYALVIPKMLCGYALEMPMPGDLELTADECGEAASLLENVVQRWEKLGSSSIEGLREGFLQRSGKLSEKEGRLHLQLESSGVDVLLDYLPWNIGLVKLPWLKDILYVEWR